MSRTKNIVTVFTVIFMFLVFITWQQITIFQMGYRLASLKEECRQLEVDRQQLLREVNTRGSLANIDRISRQQYGMAPPEGGRLRVFAIEEEPYFEREGIPGAFILALRNLFTPDSAKAN